MNKILLKRIDFFLLIIVIALFLIGMVMIYSATNAHLDGLTRQVKIQGISFIIGLVGMIVLMFFDYEAIGEHYRILYALSIIALLMVYIPGLGVPRGGARSWIDLGVIDLQTSEIAKLGFVIAYAKYLDKKGPLHRLRDLVGPILFMVPFMVLLLLQPDLGSAMVFVVMGLGMIFVVGIRLRWLVLGILIVVIAVPLIVPLLEEHQQERIEAFLNPNDPSLPGNYHVMQSKITIGSGKTLGKGYLEGEYHRYDYLPVQETDFIYAVLGEEFGFVGGATVIFLYYLLLMRMMKLSFMAKDRFGSLIIVGIACMFLFQIFENIGMTMGLMPVTGITLPFISYGGSSLITTMLAVGVVITVIMRRKRGTFIL